MGPPLSGRGTPRRRGSSPRIDFSSHRAQSVSMRKKRFEKMRRNILSKNLSASRLGIPIVLAAALVACGGCRSTQMPQTGASAMPDPGPPTVRLYLVSNLAGALEPCGCTKDQLGGLDHFAAFVASERTRAAASVVASTGPLFFMDPKLTADRAD